MKTILFLILSAILLSGCTLEVEQKQCVSSHTETYYSTEGTALWVATKNAGFLAHNGYKTREVCDEWETK